jgi:hypothetical protein
MKNKLGLIGLAVLGTVLGWLATDMFIITIGIWQFLFIELIITLFHEMYNLAKVEIIKKA